MDPAHLAGVVGAGKQPIEQASVTEAVSPLLRPLAEYAAVIGGDF